MGIKGIYREIGNGTRLALAKLVDEHVLKNDRPFRVAIDTSIWLFQVQASEGGSSPEIRTLYYRLSRLLLHGIRAIFVFDGPEKPPFKRNAPTSTRPQSADKIAKRLIELFGFTCHDAPGEAEAECALLQKLDIVDAVLSEDVDTLAFGCTLSIRSWTAEGSRGNKAPTHVTVYDASKIKQGKSGLDREGMILVALMSGGDYLPAGIPGCGTKVACEAARAGFGHDLCEINRDDEAAMVAWRERLCHELTTNESGFFQTRHKALAAKMPEHFPERDVLNYHTNPNVSSAEALANLEQGFHMGDHIDIKGLRDFVDEEFNWKHLSGAKKFLRHIAPAILAHKLRGQALPAYQSRDMDEQAEREERLILTILTRRQHFSMDGIPELRVVYIPELVADLDLDQESTIEEDENDASSSDDEEMYLPERLEKPLKEQLAETCPALNDKEADMIPRRKKSRLSEWDSKSPQKTWLLESTVRSGAPLILSQWSIVAEKQAQLEAAKARGGMRQGALETYLKVAKPGSFSSMTFSSQDERAFGKEELYEPPVNSPSSLDPHLQLSTQLASARSSTIQTFRPNSTTNYLQRKGNPSRKQQRKPPSIVKDLHTNPWTLAQRKRAQGESSDATQ